MRSRPSSLAEVSPAFRIYNFASSWEWERSFKLGESSIGISTCSPHCRADKRIISRLSYAFCLKSRILKTMRVISAHDNFLRRQSSTTLETLIFLLFKGILNLRSTIEEISRRKSSQSLFLFSRSISPKRLFLYFVVFFCFFFKSFITLSWVQDRS